MSILCTKHLKKYYGDSMVTAIGIGVRAIVAGDFAATFHFTLLLLFVCTPMILAFAVLIPYLCFKNLGEQSLVERLRNE